VEKPLLLIKDLEVVVEKAEVQKEEAVAQNKKITSCLFLKQLVIFIIYLAVQ
jgi:hypothetical protein